MVPARNGFVSSQDFFNYESYVTAKLDPPASRQHITFTRMFYILAFLLVGSTYGQTECPYLVYDQRHTACLPPNPNCKILAHGLSEADATKILHLHNQYRSQVATGNLKGFPSASNIIQLEWDPEVAMIAQKHTNQCKTESDCSSCRATDNYNYVGQNAYWLVEYNVPRDPNWANPISSWFQGYARFNPKNVMPYQYNQATSGGAAFSQIVWAQTSAMGCGYTAIENKGPNYPNVPVLELYTCNYAPGGNGWTGNSVYIPGTPCSRCLRGYSCSAEYEGLCKRNS